jgi:hypothetical protein
VKIMNLKTIQDMNKLEAMLVATSIPRFKDVGDFIEQRDTTEKRFYIDKSKIIGLGTILSTEFSKIVNIKNIEEEYTLVDSFELEIIDTMTEPQLDCIHLKSGESHELYIDAKYLSDVIGMVEDKCKLLISTDGWKPLIVETELKDEHEQKYYFAIAPVYPEDS